MERFGGTLWPTRSRVSGLVVFVSASALLLLLGAVTQQMPYPAGQPPWDSASYYAMSLDPLAGHALPFGSRWLTPALTHALPLRTEAAFELINLVSYALAATFISRLVVQQRVGVVAAVVAVGLFVTARYTAKWAFYLPVMVDALTHCLLAAGLFCVERGRRGWLLLVLCLGALQKPWVLV